MISISPACCPGDPGCSGSALKKAGSTPQAPAKLALGSSSGSGGNVAAPEKEADKVAAPSKVGDDLEEDSEPCSEF